ncbi:hypothetical protein ACFXKJ_14825 [Kitasatospora indigofera]|uniref:Gram-positive cocci surface proteins LPxTG domain-containing protein n=1 Tax=Kitasatospora indigofera TaxID=67307 RepID=A0A919KPZ7_9ACTN|nr:hypothetical protein [Kitasatospora indigofera]GHH67630.1 hypothetical protein GCM10018781_23210 [Kitasatospora indigofera]
MRSARTLLTGAAIAATLTLGGPVAAAFAADSPDAGTTLTWEEKQAKAASPEGQKTWEEKQATGKPEASSEEKAPHGGVHTGGGGMAVSGNGVASGAALLLGGLGIGAYALRRRKPSGAAI